jgi:TPR repeat protein
MKAKKPGSVRIRVARGGHRDVLLLGLVVVFCTVAAATWAVAQQMKLPDSWKLAAAVVAAVGAAIAIPVGNGFITGYRDRRQRRRQLASQLSLDFRFVSGLSGPRVADKHDPYELGVTKAAVRNGPERAADAAGPSVPPHYVWRDIDTPEPGVETGELGAALGAFRFVLIRGASKVGKSRTAFEAMQRTFPDRLLLVPTRKASLPRLLEAEEVVGAGLQLPDCVIWLDDLEKYIGAEGLTKNVLERLTSEGHGRVTVLATMRTEEWPKPNQEVGEDVWQLVDSAHRVDLERKLSAEELSRAEEAGSDPRIAAAISHADRYGLAEYLAAGPELLDRLMTGRTDNPPGVAIVRAAVDWRRAGLLRAAPAEALRRLFPIYLEDRRARHLDAQAFQTGLLWATERICGTAALLDEDETEGYRAFEYIVDNFERRAGSHEETVPTESWNIVLGQVTDPEEAFDVGVAAYNAKQAVIAERGWRVAAEAGEATAAKNLGVLLVGLDRKPEAEAWYQQAAEAGDATAANNLGVLLGKLDRKPEAEAWFRQAADAGHANAAFNLGVQLVGLNRKPEAEAWFRQAADAGHADAAYNLAALLVGLDRKPEAEAWYRQAADAGHAGAAYNLGVLLVGLNRKPEAEAWYRQAAEAGDADAAFNLGVLLVGLDRKPEAEAWYQQAAEAGDAHAAFNLAALLVGLDRKPEAEAWYRQAAEAGDAHAAFNLGVLLEELDRKPEAEAWYQHAAEAGDATAANNLGVLLGKLDRKPEAEAWFRQAAEAGNTNAAKNLGILLEKLDRTPEVEA